MCVVFSHLPALCFTAQSQVQMGEKRSPEVSNTQTMKFNVGLILKLT